MNCIDDGAGASTPSRDSLPHTDSSGATAGGQLIDQLQSSHPVLLHWMHRKLGDHALAADLLNRAVLITLEHQRAGRLRCGGDLVGHVFKIGMELLRKQRQAAAERPHSPVTSEAATPVSQGNSAATDHDERLRQTVRLLLESLRSPRDSQIIARFYLDGADKASLCRQFNISGLQFSLIVARVRQRMQATLERQQPKAAGKA